MIRSLDGIPNECKFLETLDLEDNKIIDINEIDYLLELELLRDLNLNKNPIRELNEYRLSIIFKLDKLLILDKHKIETLEKVNSQYLFHPSIEYISSRDHMTNLVFSFIQDHHVKERYIYFFFMIIINIFYIIKFNFKYIT
jgi:Leucine-rich repeat (LRR) protein